MNLLVTGGAGYIGSHTCVELLRAGFEPVVVDNLSNSKMEAIRRVERIAGRKLVFYRADIRDRTAMRDIMARHGTMAVIHFAGLKAVGESVAEPLLYYDNNVAGTISLCGAMADAGVKRMVNIGADMGFEGVVALNEALRRPLEASSDYAEGINAFFDNRKPVFRGK